MLESLAAFYVGEAMEKQVLTQLQGNQTAQARRKPLWLHLAEAV